MLPNAFRRALCSSARPSVRLSQRRLRVHHHVRLDALNLGRRAFSVTLRVRDETPALGKQEELAKPRSLLAMFKPEPESASSLRKIVSLAKPERATLSVAVALLFVSSSVSMSIPFTIGKLIDYFASSSVEIPFGLSPTAAAGVLLSVCTVGALASATRTYLMKMSGQRIIARVREQTYASALRQEVEFVERGEGDVLSRLGSDATIVGES